MQNITATVNRDYFGELNEILVKIAALNFYSLVQEISHEKYKECKRDCLNLLFNHNFFQAQRRFDARVMIECNIENKFYFEFLTNSSVPLAPIPDEDNLYCLSAPTNIAKDQEEPIPNKDTLLTSYKWENLFNIDSLIKELTPNSEQTTSRHQLIRERLKSLLCFDFDYSEYSTARIIDICFFGLDPNEGSSFSIYRNCYTPYELEEILLRMDNFKHLKREDYFTFFAFKVLPYKKENKSSSKVKGCSPRTFILFIDSLDLSILKEKRYSNRFNVLRKIYSKSIHYQNFTASAGWTFPVLHSIHTGVPSYVSGSEARHDPGRRFLELKKKSEHYTYGDQRIQNSLILEDRPLRSENFLTRLISAEGVIQAGIKNSANHGYLYGLTHSLDITFENTSWSRLISNYDLINKLTGDANISTIYMDIDTLHGPERIIQYPSINWETSSLDLLKPKQSKEERLISKFKNKELEKLQYIDRMHIVDEILTSLLKSIEDEDNVVIFSDHGSDCFQFEGQKPFGKKPTSIQSFEKIWKPTLLVYAPANSLFSGHYISDELVSSIDLHSIILKLHNIEPNNFSPYSILPKSLGGERERESAYTASYGLSKNAYRIMFKDTDPNCEDFKYYYEIIERNGEREGRYHSHQFNPEVFEVYKNSTAMIEEMFPGAKNALPFY